MTAAVAAARTTAVAQQLDAGSMQPLGTSRSKDSLSNQAHAAADSTSQAGDASTAAAKRAVNRTAKEAIAAAAEVAVVVAPAEAALFNGQQPPPRGSWTTMSYGKWYM